MEELSRYKALIEADIAEHSQTLLARWQRYFGLETAQVLDSYVAVLSRSGGKRLRGILGVWAYFFAGGEDETLAVQLARALEVVHAYLLVVDDVADQSHTRRGGPTAHKLLEKYHQDEGWFGSAAHFGQVQAINASLAAQNLVMQDIAELAVGDSIKLEALRELNAILFQTGIGQISDINNQALRDVTEHEVIAMMRQKTALYSFVSPLQFGVIMAGKDWSDYVWLEQWALNIGLGFQINDDILGVFGDEKVSGKSNLDDIREGKMTLLITRALGHATPEQKKVLLRLLGDQSLDHTGLEQAQTIIEESGALDYCRRLAKNYTQKALESLDSTPSAYKKQTAPLIELSQVLVRRQS